MNNEPVAWLWTKDGKPQSALLHEPDTVPSDPYWKDKGFKAIPLYTHPHQDNLGLALSIIDQQKLEIEALKTKTLTDEEILTAIKEFAEEVMPYKEYENTYSDGWLDACNEIYSAVFAILRKTQEG